MEIDIILGAGGITFYRNKKTRLRHREDGPAIEWENGLKKWYLFGVEYSFEEYIIEANWSDEQVIMYKLKYM